MAVIDSIEYSVCQDCLMYAATDEDIADYDAAEAAVARELNGRTGHFSTGIEPTEDDPEGTGYEEFSWQECELCRSTLGGSRHGITLLITGEATCEHE